MYIYICILEVEVTPINERNPFFSPFFFSFFWLAFGNLVHCSSFCPIQHSNKRGIGNLVILQSNLIWTKRSLSIFYISFYFLVFMYSS